MVKVHVLWGHSIILLILLLAGCATGSTISVETPKPTIDVKLVEKIEHNSEIRSVAGENACPRVTVTADSVKFYENENGTGGIINIPQAQLQGDANHCRIYLSSNGRYLGLARYYFTGGKVSPRREFTLFAVTNKGLQKTWGSDNIRSDDVFVSNKGIVACLEGSRQEIAFPTSISFYSPEGKLIKNFHKNNPTTLTVPNRGGFSENGEYFVVAGPVPGTEGFKNNQAILLFNENAILLWRQELQFDIFTVSTEVAISPNGENIIWSGQSIKPYIPYLYILNNKGDIVKKHSFFADQLTEKIAFSPDATSVVIANGGQLIRFKLPEGTIEWQHSEPNAEFYSVGVSNSGQKTVAGMNTDRSKDDSPRLIVLFDENGNKIANKTITEVFKREGWSRLYGPKPRISAAGDKIEVIGKESVFMFEIR